MTQENQQTENTEQNPAKQESTKTPLEMVKEQQAMQQQNREVQEQRAEHSPEVPGVAAPSNRRKHPQRQLG